MNPFGVTRRAPLTTATFLAWNSGVTKARAAHEETKADHALPYGCETCTKGAATERPRGWSIVAGLLFCPNYIGLVPTKRLIAETVARRKGSS